MLFDFVLKNYKKTAELPKMAKILLIVYSISGILGLVSMIAFNIIDTWGNASHKVIEPYIFYFSMFCFLILFITILCMLIYQDKQIASNQSKTAIDLIKKRYTATNSFLVKMELATSSEFKNIEDQDFYIDFLIRECGKRIDEINSSKSELSKIIANTLKVFIVPVMTGSAMDYSLKNAQIFKDNPGLIIILIICYVIILVSILILCKMIEKAINEKKMKEVYDLQKFKNDLELYKIFRGPTSEQT